MTTKHTQLPWHIEDVERDFVPAWPQVCIQTDDWTIALCGRSTNKQAQANAALIIKAVNHFEETREALRRLVNLTNHPLFIRPDDLPAWDEWLDSARALLAKLEEHSTVESVG